MADQSKQELRVSGEVIETLPSLRFRVRLDDEREIHAYLSGKLVVHRIRILPGDRVTVEMSPYDQTKGRIVYRDKK
ncbi:MAG: translation initiation factor IF-1 [Candidatus Yanofskybacteria bacterium]|nr:translation initiation factor IF-1 [Candidatus Yanofskybacteria bacterium]